MAMLECNDQRWNVNRVQAVQVVSDGVIIVFENEDTLYFSASALHEHQLLLGAHSFLPYDPSHADHDNGSEKTLMLTPTTAESIVRV